MSKENQIQPLMNGKAEMEDIENNKTTIRQIFEKFLQSKYGRYIENISTVISLFSYMLWLIGTYMEKEIQWQQSVDIGFLIFYSLEYSLRLFTAQNRFNFVLSYWSVTDLVTMMPIVLLQEKQQPFIQNLIDISRIMRIVRVVRFLNRVYKIDESESSSVSRQMFTIILTILTLVLVTSGVILTFEKPKRRELMQLSKQNLCGKQYSEVSFHEMVYFVVVTLATVGYGDVVPESEEGRVCVIIFIVIVLVLLPKQSNELIRLMGMQSFYARDIYQANSEVPHIIISGHVGVAALKNFCNELFHPDHGNQDKNAIILQSSVPSQEMEIFLHNPQYELFLTYLQGNPMLERDLKRSSTTKSKACVILTNKYGKDSYSADHKNILTGLAIKKYVYHQTGGESIRLCMQLIKPESKTHYYSSLNIASNDQLIIIEEFKMNLLAKSCFSPGIIALLSNLTQSSGDFNYSDFDEEWLKEYVQGMGHEIYRTDLSYKFQGKSFSVVAGKIYHEFQGILFGIELDIGGQTIIRLNPGTYIIPDTIENNVHGYIICEDKEVADQVATYDMSPEEIALYQMQKTQRQKSKDRKEKMKQQKGYVEMGGVEEEEEERTEEEEEEVNNDDYELLETDYVLLNEPVSLMSVSPISLKDSNEIINHIVVCGIHPSIYYFLLPLRARYLKEFQYVVIIASEKPTEIWEYINRFPKILFIKGSPLLTEDLMRANINFADKAVILGQDIENRGDDDNNFDEMVDAESIFIYKAIKKCNKNIQIMIELVYNSNIEFLLNRDTKDQDFQYEFTSLFAAGQVYISSIIDTLTCQSYFNPHIVTILQQILTGGKQSNAVIRAITDHADLKQSNLWQINIPEDYLNKTFGDLFNYLSTERHLIPLGLYRLPGALDNQQAYVYTNPKKNVKLTHKDKVFVLSFNMPNDLLSGVHDQKMDFNLQAKDNNYQKKEDFQMTQTENNNNQQKQEKRENKIKEQGFDRKKKENKTNKIDLIKKPQKMQNLDLENINLNSATYLVLDQIDSHLTEMKEEIELIKSNLAIQDQQIIEKVKNALRQELSTITQ